MPEPIIADFSNSEMSTEELLAAIAALSPDTTDLIIDSNGLETMPCLRHLPNLTIVCIQNNRIKSLGNLSYLSKLIHLFAYSNPIAYYNLAMLPDSLEEIFISADFGTNVANIAANIKLVNVWAYREIADDFKSHFPNATFDIHIEY